MPKMKPCKGILSRMRVTKNGKVVRPSAGTAHRKAIKNAKRRRQLRRIKPLSPTAAKLVKKLIGA